MPDNVSCPAFLFSRKDLILGLALGNEEPRIGASALFGGIGGADAVAYGLGLLAGVETASNNAVHSGFVLDEEGSIASLLHGHLVSLGVHGAAERTYNDIVIFQQGRFSIVDCCHFFGTVACLEHRSLLGNGLGLAGLVVLDGSYFLNFLNGIGYGSGFAECFLRFAARQCNGYGDGQCHREKFLHFGVCFEFVLSILLFSDAKITKIFEKSDI